MTNKRFTYFQNRIGNWIIEDNIDDKYLINTPSFLGFNNEEGVKLFCEVLNEIWEENQKLLLQQNIYESFGDEVLKILRKYEINSLEKLDRVLMEQRVW